MSSSPSTPAPGASLASLLARLYWMIAGSALLALLALSIAFQRTPSLSISDLAFWAVAATMAVVRWADVRLLGGQTGDGKPATLAHWRRYAVSLLGIALGVWLAAHASARLGLLA